MGGGKQNGGTGSRGGDGRISGGGERGQSSIGERRYKP